MLKQVSLVLALAIGAVGCKKLTDSTPKEFIEIDLTGPFVKSWPKPVDSFKTSSNLPAYLKDIPNGIDKLGPRSFSENLNTILFFPEYNGDKEVETGEILEAAAKQSNIFIFRRHEFYYRDNSDLNTDKKLVELKSAMSTDALTLAKVLRRPTYQKDITIVAMDALENISNGLLLDFGIRLSGKINKSQYLFTSKIQRNPPSQFSDECDYSILVNASNFPKIFVTKGGYQFKNCKKITERVDLRFLSLDNKSAILQFINTL